MTPEIKLKKLLEQDGRGAASRLAEYLGVPRGYISRWAKGTTRYKIPKEMLPKIAKFFGVPIDYFFNENKEVGIKLVPFIGKASCGIPIDHFYDVIDQIPVPSTLGGDLYAVEAEGDSMSPKINHGDIVLCDKDKEVKSGDIVHYTIDGQSGIKKIKFIPDGVVLAPLNLNYEPVFISERELEHLPHRFVKCIRVITNL